MSAPSLSTVFQLIQGVRVVQTLQGARELGIFSRLQSGPATLDELAWETGIAAPRLRVLMDALEAMELLDRSGTDYALRVQHAVVDKMLQLRDIPAALRGQPAWNGHTPEGANAAYPQVVQALSSAMREPAARAAEILAAPGQRVLEIGAGACAWSLALVARSDDIRVTVNDLPAVVEQSKRAVRAAGRMDQYDFLPGDWFTVDPGERRYDLVILPMILHLFDEATAARAIRRAAKVLAPGGQVVMIDIFVPRGHLDLAAALYSLELLSRTAEGRVHHLEAAHDWLAEAGLEAPTTRVLEGPGPIQLVSGSRQAVNAT